MPIQTDMPLDDVILHMRTIGDQLVPYNFPQADPRLEDDLNPLKTKEVIVDGYYLVLHFSKADYKTHYLETLQILGSFCPFLPFHLVIKLARKFLGSHHLCLVEILKENRKIYCWTIMLNKRGCPIPPPPQKLMKTCSYDGFEYTYMDSSQIRFY